MISNWSYSPETPNLSQNGQFLELCDLAIWHMTLKIEKNNRAPLLCYFKLCTSFRSHWWIQTGVTVRKRQIWVKIDDFFSRVTLQFDIWPWKAIGFRSRFSQCVDYMHFNEKQFCFRWQETTKLMLFGSTKMSSLGILCDLMYLTGNISSVMKNHRGGQCKLHRFAYLIVQIILCF